MEENPTTQELRIVQGKREGEERDRAERAPTDEAAEAHTKRADKNAYLRRRLEERADAEREAERQAAEADRGEHGDDPRREP